MEFRGCNSTLFLIGDWKVPKTRRQECLRHVAQAFQPAGFGIFPDASPRGAESAAQERCQAALSLGLDLSTSEHRDRSPRLWLFTIVPDLGYQFIQLVHHRDGRHAGFLPSAAVVKDSFTTESSANSLSSNMF